MNFLKLKTTKKNEYIYFLCLQGLNYDKKKMVFNINT